MFVLVVNHPKPHWTRAVSLLRGRLRPEGSNRTEVTVLTPASFMIAMIHPGLSESREII
ncbi:MULTISPECIES: hypothetical protein [Bacteroidales]|uniref:hypothetical protein n=1 Tax=Bacteroidales TaxID=171549 RepID=UPI000A83462C|nr:MULTISPECIES: hypothetical protein [Bacteroidales]